MHAWIKYGLTLLIFASVASVNAQLNSPLDHQNRLLLDEHANWLYADNDELTLDQVHTGFKPFSSLKVYAAPIKIEGNGDDSPSYWIPTPNTEFYLKYCGIGDPSDAGWFKRKFFEENLIQIRDDNKGFYMTADPLFHFQVGSDLASDSSTVLYQNTRGFRVQGDIGKNLSFETTFYENQARHPEYIDNYTAFYGVVPGFGRVKALENGGYDYAMASGYVSYSPTSWVNIQFGHGKHFVGDGYRSLLLSDNAFNYPYFRTTVSLFNGKVQYTSMFTSMQSLERMEAATTPEAIFKKKAGAFHHLSINLGSRIQLGLFEGALYRRVSESGTLPINYAQYIPIIGAHALMNGLDSANNVMLGFTGKIKVLNQIHLYGQLAIDGLGDHKKLGVQGGFRWLNLLKSDRHKLSIQGELNLVTGHSYSMPDPLRSYTHYNQSLTHPMGAGFTELMGIVDYEWKRVFTRVKVNLANYKKPGIGTDPLQPETDINTLVVPEPARLTIVDFKLGYLLMPKTNMNVYAGLVMRNLSSGSYEHNTMWVQVGFRTWLTNQYFDF